MIENLINELNPYQYKDYIKVYFLKNFEEFKGNDTKNMGRVLIVLEVWIGKTTTGSIYKYILIRNNLRWDYWKSRQDIKRMIRIVEKLGIDNDGKDLSEEEFEKISSEKIVPRNILSKFRMVTWYPYDYDGSFNDRIDESEFEQDEDFKYSLKEIDKEVFEMFERKKQEFRDKYK
ncbi:hypothetical protein ACFTQ7_24515 [Lysinibacillus sp. NPDC056959]|uniref:hypothetical protein n=1 Tax=Lysinibacillus sp. NPDC056959 TaxID=3345981 RepID=UPI003628C758